MIKLTKLPENIMRLLPKAEGYPSSQRKVLFAYLFGSSFMKITC